MSWELLYYLFFRLGCGSCYRVLWELRFLIVIVSYFVILLFVYLSCCTEEKVFVWILIIVRKYVGFLVFRLLDSVWEES